ncbi:MAG: esterase/lipase family protein [Spirochaetota bacterium]
MKNTAALIGIIFFILNGCAAVQNKKDPGYCAARYPVVFVHGVGFRDRSLTGKYWGNTPEVLTAHGAHVFSGGQDAYGTISGNAELLKKNILVILEKTGAKKVNIIGHSRGGLEARYMITKLDMKDKVASLTTVSTPHRGSSMADVIMKQITDDDFLISAIDFFAGIVGDDNPASYNAGIELTRSRMETFNKDVPDAPDVYYQSYAGEIDENIGSRLWKSMFLTINKYEGPNDGLVSINSAKWGTFKGVMACDGKARVSHADEIGRHYMSGEFCFDSESFYLNVVHELKEMGF